MKFVLISKQRRYVAPRSAIAAAVALVLLGIAAAATPGHEGGPVVCPFRAVTGLPCPTCGTVRAAGLILRGHVGEGFRTNPLGTAAMIVAAPLFLALWMANATRGWALRVDASARERSALWATGALVLASNWAYVLLTQAG